MKRPKQKYFIVPFNSKKINGRQLVTNRLGGWAFLEEEDFAALNAFGIVERSPLYERLKAKGVVVDEANVQNLLQEYRQLNRNLFLDTGLHIAVVTNRCNMACSYCQVSAAPDEKDMSIEVAARVILYLCEVRRDSVALELQGGEPLMNWPVVAFLIENAHKANAGSKSLKIAVVSNLLLLDEQKMSFLDQHDVALCTSLDGPEDVHDHNRKLIGGRGSYREVMAKVSEFRAKFGRRVSMLPTITRFSLKHPRRIVDEYVSNGQTEICLRPVNNMGNARCSWRELGYSAAEFMDFYCEATEYILELNRQGVDISERMARVIATKVLLKQDPGYVDLMNPCGAGRAVITYTPDGGCYPCDEARMMGNNLFRLGNIVENSYQDVMTSANLLSLLEASCSDIWKTGSVFSPWSGYCPVVNYAVQKNIVPKTACSSAQSIQDGQFEFVFSKLSAEGQDMNILRDWAIRGGYENKSKKIQNV